MIHVLIKDLKVGRSGDTGQLLIILLKLLHNDAMGIQQVAITVILYTL